MSERAERAWLFAFAVAGVALFLYLLALKATDAYRAQALTSCIGAARTDAQAEICGRIFSDRLTE